MPLQLLVVLMLGVRSQLMDIGPFVITNDDDDDGRISLVHGTLSHLPTA
jgi:hypothetical protein